MSIEPHFLLLPKDIMRLILRDSRCYQQTSSTCADFAKLHGGAVEWKQYYKYECSYELCNTDSTTAPVLDNTPYTWSGPIAATNDIMNGVLKQILVTWKGRTTVGAVQEQDGFTVYCSSYTIVTCRDNNLIYIDCNSKIKNSRVEIVGDNVYATTRYVHTLGRVSDDCKKYNVEFAYEGVHGRIRIEPEFIFTIRLVEVGTRNDLMIACCDTIPLLKIGMRYSLRRELFLFYDEIEKLIDKFPPLEQITRTKLRDFGAAMQIYDAWMGRKN